MYWEEEDDWFSGVVVKFAPAGSVRHGRKNATKGERVAILYDDDDTVWWSDLESEEVIIGDNLVVMRVAFESLLDCERDPLIFLIRKKLKVHLVQVEFLCRLTGKELVGWRGSYEKRHGVVIAWVPESESHVFRYDVQEEGEDSDVVVSDLSRDMSWFFLSLSDRDVEKEAEDSSEEETDEEDEDEDEEEDEETGSESTLSSPGSPLPQSPGPEKAQTPLSPVVEDALLVVEEVMGAKSADQNGALQGQRAPDTATSSPVVRVTSPRSHCIRVKWVSQGADGASTIRAADIPSGTRLSHLMHRLREEYGSEPNPNPNPHPNPNWIGIWFRADTPELRRPRGRPGHYRITRGPTTRL